MPIHSLPQKISEVSIKSSFVTIFFLLLLASGAMAQEKYEYAIIYNNSFLKKVFVATATYEETFNVTDGVSPVSELISKVEEMNKLGWEVYNSTLGLNKPLPYERQFELTHSFYLRKKKN